MSDIHPMPDRIEPVGSCAVIAPACTCGVQPWPSSGLGVALWSFKPVKVLHDDDCPVVAPFLEACGESAVSIAKRGEARLFDLLVAPCPPAPTGGTSTT